ncbi:MULTISPECIES: HAMP domain-containing sensor histidine kinase [unclassified Leptolyngbya]|uniref:sensor histidine kinase n=1 Tax=unclassified Leptolyngbya TaxID=2650499 RepID=UPI0016885FC7|nr:MULTISPECIES: HAMP domain-containing sensor histidine kinase [unclassified Leptolyngbya]MBD1911344.1 HAMP domain-containing histidine kinase [Leptolyngbya sp. FACHB-8]MBD2156638.1 HAMP domain-containing histidine kinase [Leptolyngbya sp. FACHB-16]
MFNRSRSNLATGFTLSMGSILVVFAAILYLREARDRLQTFDQLLYSTSRIMVAGVEDYIYNGKERTDLENVPVLGSDTLPLSSNLFFARWYTPEKQLLQFMGEIPPSKLSTPLGMQTLIVKDSLTATPLRLRQLTLPVYQDERVIGYLQIAADLKPVEEPLRQLRGFLVVGVPLALGAIALTGWVLGGRAMQPIRQSYEQLQQFTADASHELRAPLAGILSQAQVGMMEPVDPQEQQTRLKTIAHVAESMSLLVSQLLFLARHEGKLPSDALKSVDLVFVLRLLLDEYTLQTQQKQQTLSWDLPSVTVSVQGEPDLLRQAIANLLSNAHRYTPHGGTIHLTLSTSPRWATLRIQDTGIGIASDDLSLIFDRFYRADQARSRQTGGFGLGLAIARQIIEAHGGSITAESIVGQGSTFQVRLPFIG